MWTVSFLVLNPKQAKFFNDMAKVNIKSEKITAFGGIFFVLDKFDSIFIDALVKTSRPYGVRGRCLHTSQAQAFLSPESDRIVISKD